MNEITVLIPDATLSDLHVEAARMGTDVEDVVQQAAALWLVLENPEEVIDESDS